MKAILNLSFALVVTLSLATAISAQSVETSLDKKTQTPKTKKSDSPVLACGCCKQGGASLTSPVILALDIDKDGAISAAEIRNAQQSLSALDLNGDGKLSRVEMHARSEFPETNAPVVSKSQAGVTKGFYAKKILQKYDRNLNGQIDQDELTGRILAMVDMIDSDGDNVLTVDELKNLNNQIRANIRAQRQNADSDKPKRGKRKNR